MASGGPAALTDAELLAIFFGTGTVGLSAIDLGKLLVEKYGSLNALSRLRLEEIQVEKGIGPAKAVNLAAAFELGARLAKERYRDQKVDSPEAVYDLLGPEMNQLGRESLRVVILNTRNNLIRVEEVSLGTANECIAHPREILQSVVMASAHGFILAHNHPSGDPSPSAADRKLTRRLSEASELLGVTFIDHVIIGLPGEGHEPYFSFKEMGLL